MLGRQVSQEGVDKRGAAQHFKIAARAPVLIGPMEHCTGAGFVGDLLQRWGTARNLCPASV